MTQLRVNLTTSLDQFVENQLSGGRFRDASEVVSAGLRLLERQSQEDEQKLALLRCLADEAFQELDQGQGIELNDQREVAQFINAVDQRAAKQADQRASDA